MVDVVVVDGGGGVSRVAPALDDFRPVLVLPILRFNAILVLVEPNFEAIGLACDDVSLQWGWRGGEGQ